MRYIQMKQPKKIDPFELQCLQELIDNTIKRRGSQYPNPAVGAMVLLNGQLISEGYHLLHGEAHAEVEAIQNAGDKVRGSTLIITLEPCTHRGHTPPCVQAIIDAKIARVLWAINDPNPVIFGKAKSILEAQGIDVVDDCLPEAGRRCLPEFYNFYVKKRPFIYVKAAMSLDGMIAPNSDGLNYISSKESLHLVQQLRTYVQAICVGSNTINTDLPRLTVRIKQLKPYQPAIVILDPKNNINESWIDTALNAGRTIVLFRTAPFVLTHSNLRVHMLPMVSKSDNWKIVYDVLFEMNIHGVLIEGGTGIFSSILRSRLFDELWITKVPNIFGQHAIPFIKTDQSIDFDLSIIDVQTYGQDVVIKYKNNYAF